VSQRLAFIDVAKGLGMLLVALGHNRAVSGTDFPETHRLIYLFHMPMFFLLAGVTLSRDMDSSALLKRVRSLVWPYFFSILIFLPRQLSIPEHPSNDWMPWSFLWASGNYIYNTPAWFLVALCTGFIGVHVLRKTMKSTATPRVGVFVAILLVVFNYIALSQDFFGLPVFTDQLGRPLGWPLNLDLFLMVTGFVLTGVSCSEWIKNLAHRSSAYVVGLLFLSAVVLAGSFYLGADVDLNYRRVEYVFFAVLAAFSGSSLILLLSVLIDRMSRGVSRLFQLIGRGSLFVLIFHSAIQSIAVKAYGRVIETEVISAALISFAVCYALALFNEVVVVRTKAGQFLVYGK
jgi:polysaccharide biosynthesis protein PslL